MVGLKVKRRQLDATESSKHLGHGLCDSFSKSAALEFHTDDAQLIFEVALNLLKCYKFNAEDIRGTKLNYLFPNWFLCDV
jgi:DNA repair protein REV1